MYDEINSLFVRVLIYPFLETKQTPTARPNRGKEKEIKEYKTTGRKDAR